MKKDIIFMIAGLIIAATIFILSINIAGCPYANSIILTVNTIFAGLMLTVFSYGLWMFLKRKKIF